MGIVFRTRKSRSTSSSSSSSKSGGSGNSSSGSGGSSSRGGGGGPRRGRSRDPFDKATGCIRLLVLARRSRVSMSCHSDSCSHVGHLYMGSCLNRGPVEGPVCKGAVLFWRPLKGTLI